MSLTIKRVVNVAINEQGQIAKNRDFSVIAILTDEICEAFNEPKTRFINVASAQDVASNFGSDSRVVAAAKALFAVSGIKKAVVAKWVKTGRTTQASANELRGSALNVGLNKLKEITDGSFKLSVGGVVKSYTGIDLHEAVDFETVAAKITEKITADKLKAVYDSDGSRFKIVAVTAGAKADTKLGYMSANDSGTFIGAMLNLIEGKSDIINGTDSVTLPKETLSEALDKLFNANQNFYGVYSAATLSDDELGELESWVSTAQTPHVAAYTITRDTHLSFENSNIIKKIFNKDSGRFIGTSGQHQLGG